MIETVLKVSSKILEIILPYLFEYNAQNFIPKKELKVWVRVINEGWGDTLRCISILFAR